MRPSILGGVAAFAILLSAWQPVRADGYTNEQEAWYALQQGRYPLALSADGRWRIHYDSQHRLHRVSIANAAIDQSIVLPLDAVDLSASRTGRLVAFSTTQGCFGLIDFGAPNGASPPIGRWIGPEQVVPKEAACPKGFEFSYRGHDAIEQHYSEMPAIALSSDGKLAALGGDPIQLIDVTSHAVIGKIPARAMVMHLQFVDANRKLLVVQAVMGERWEAAADPSDMQFALWDLRSGQVQNFAHTQPTSSLDWANFLWSFAERTGILRTFVSGVESTTRRAPMVIVSANLKHCAPQFSRVLDASLTGDKVWAAMVTDPSGRWLAAVRDASSDPAQQASDLALYDLASGRLRKAWKLDAELRALAVTPDGRTIFATTVGKSLPNQISGDYMLQGGGEVRRFDLPADALTAAPEADGAWMGDICPIEDEQPHARDIADSKRVLTSDLTIPLSNLEQMRANLGAPPTSTCQESVTDHSSEDWGMTPEGGLWVDRFNTLERIDPLNGHVLQSLKTPRTVQRCSVVLYAQRGFLNYQGDTIAFQPFNAALPKRLIAVKPGWLIKNIEFSGTRLLVQWIDRLQVPDRHSDQGNTTNVVYDVVAGRAIRNPTEDDVFASDEGFISDSAVFGDSPRPPEGSITWQASYFGSVRAVEQGAHPGETKTLLWAGLNFRNPLPPNEFDLGQILPSASPSVGVVQTLEDVALYDAVTRRILAHRSVDGTMAMRILPTTRQVVTEVDDTKGHYLLIAPLP